MPITNQQIFSELQEVKTSIKDLKETQQAQGKQILDILLKEAKEDGKKEGEEILIHRRKNDKVMFWTTVASLATGIGSIITVITFVTTFHIVK